MEHHYHPPKRTKVAVSHQNPDLGATTSSSPASTALATYNSSTGMAAMAVPTGAGLGRRRLEGDGLNDWPWSEALMEAGEGSP